MLNQKKIDQIEALGQSGLGYRQIASKVGCSVGTVVKYLKTNGSQSQNLPAVVKSSNVIEMDDENEMLDELTKEIELCGGPIDYMIMEFRNSVLFTAKKLMKDPNSEPITVDDLDLAIKDLRYDLENMDYLTIAGLVHIDFDGNFRYQFVYQKAWDKIQTARYDRESIRLNYENTNNSY